MPNWTNITPDDLKASGHGLIVDRAQTLATGGVDPVTDAIDNAVARVRRAVQAGNALDAIATKVPRSLKAVTVRLVLFALMERIGLPLSEDQRKTRENDNSDLLRIADRKVRLEPADDPSTDAAGPINPGTWNSERKIVARMHPVPPPATQHAPGGGYANPDAPEDSAE